MAPKMGPLDMKWAGVELEEVEEAQRLVRIPVHRIVVAPLL